MADLPDLFESLGYASVETYIQSGNVMFDTAVDDENELRESIHAAIEDEFGYDLEVMIRTRDELSTVVAESPFGTPARDGIRRYVTFLHEEPTAERRDALLAANHEAETLVVRGRDVYSELDKDAWGMAVSPMSRGRLEW